MNSIKVKNYDLKATLESGQILTVQNYQGKYYVSTSQLIIELYQEGDNIFWQTYPTPNQEIFVKEFLRIDEDYNMILEKISKDKYIKTAIERYKNLRLVKQLFPDALISFITSSNKNIPAIKTSLKKISERLGKEVIVRDTSFYLLPSIEIIAKADISVLKETGVGYRAEYLKKSSVMVPSIDLHPENIKEELLHLPGVGNKVADCILLYGLKKDEITPLDRWGYKFLQQYYKLDTKMKYEDLSNWARDYFNGYAGWAGQYLFEYIKSTKQF